MSAAALALLAAFDALPDADRDLVVGELLLRQPAGSEDMSDEAFVALADEVFLTCDAAEAAGAAPAR